MSRSGYSDDCDGWALIRWRGAVASAVRGQRGQALLRELVLALDALPEKRLGAESLVTEDGDFCTLGALGRARGLDMAPIDPDDREAVARAFGTAEALAAEIMYLNDECASDEWLRREIEICGPMRPHYPDWGRHARSVRVHNPQAAEQRWAFMRKWALENLRATSTTQPADGTAVEH